MIPNSIGDLARSLTLSARSTEIRSQIETLSYEMSTGDVRNVSDHLGGDYAHLLDFNSSLERLDAYKLSATEAGLFTDAMQQSMGVFKESVSEMSSALLSFGTAHQVVTYENASVLARNELDTMVSALNTRAGGRSLYSGIATDVSPIASKDALLSALEVELTGLVTIADIRLAAENWFNDPAGFDAVIYQGSATSLAPMTISENEQIDLPITATDPAFKSALRDVAVAALVADDALNLPLDQRELLFEQLGVSLANAQNDTIQMRAQIGAAEARIEQAATRNAAAMTSIEFAHNQLIAADPYETATQLQTVQFQLESLYSVTVRNAGLSLVNFL